MGPLDIPGLVGGQSVSQPVPAAFGMTRTRGTQGWLPRISHRKKSLCEERLSGLPLHAGLLG